MTKILNYGAMNIDYIFEVPHFVMPGESLTALKRTRSIGGKGTNQSVALARAGAEVYHAACIGEDGLFIRDFLQEAGADVSRVSVVPEANGQALIQLTPEGQNCIVYYPGANHSVTEEKIEKDLEGFGAGDWVLLQNEITGNAAIMKKAHEKGMKIALNPSPVDSQLDTYPLDLVSCFIVNEVEGEALTGEKEPEKILSAFRKKYPAAILVLTLGTKGSYYSDPEKTFFQDIFPCKAVDTTAAGDTFSGYFFAGLLSGDPPEICMKRAAKASSIAVTRMGASPSIPRKEEVEI